MARPRRLNPGTGKVSRERDQRPLTLGIGERGGPDPLHAGRCLTPPPDASTIARFAAEVDARAGDARQRLGAELERYPGTDREQIELGLSRLEMQGHNFGILLREEHFVEWQNLGFRCQHRRCARGTLGNCWLTGIARATPFIMIALLTLSGCINTRHLELSYPLEHISLRVGTYNIRSGRSGQGIDLQRIADEISDAELDIVFLQEVDRHTNRSGRVDQADALAQMLGMHHTVATADRTMDGGALGNAILSRFPLTQTGGQRLPGSVFRVRRAAAYAVVEGPAEVRLLAVSTHFSLSTDDRTRSSRWLAEQVAVIDGPVVVGIDLNAGRYSRETEILGEALELSRPMSTYPAGDPRLALDRIGVAPADVTAITAVELGGVGGSDHRMVVAEIVIRTAR